MGEKTVKVKFSSGEQEIKHGSRLLSEGGRSRAVNGQTIYEVPAGQVEKLRQEGADFAVIGRLDG